MKFPKVFKKYADIDNKSRIVVFENIRKELQLLWQQTLTKLMPKVLKKLLMH